jgi:hypothetical protein
VSLASITSLLRIRREKEKANPSVKSNKRTQDNLSQVPNGIELIWRLGEDLIYWMCLRMQSFALAMNGMFGMLGWIWMRWLGGFIAPNHFHSRWWRLLVMGAPDNHCALSGARYVSATVRVWSWSAVGAFVVLLHQAVQCHTGQSGALWLLCSDFWRGTVAHCSSCQSTVGVQGAVARLVHRTVRWIIAERAL